MANRASTFSLTEHAGVFTDETALIVGQGTGPYSMLAVQTGAKAVVCFERTPSLYRLTAQFLAAQSRPEAAAIRLSPMSILSCKPPGMPDMHEAMLTKRTAGALDFWACPVG